MARNLYLDGTKLNRHLKEVVQWQEKKDFAPIHLEISVSNFCNQKCIFCYIDWQHGQVNMSEEMLVSLLIDAKKAGVKSVLLAGEGEPTLNKAYIAGIKKAGEVGLDIALNSNMVAVSQEELYEILPHLSWLRCSVQAGDAKTYSQMHNTKEKDFERAISNIQQAVDIKKELNLDLKIGIQQVLMQENIHSAYTLARLAQEVGVDYYVIKPCHPHELTKYKVGEDLVHRYTQILRQIEELSTPKFNAIIRWEFLNIKQRVYKKCLALPFIWQINATGDIYTCYPKANDKRHLYGSLKEQTFSEILASKRYKEVVSWVENNVDVTKCMLPCRHHNANDYLWWLTEEEPLHINFI